MMEHKNDAALPSQQRDDQRESLTDLFDRMDREAFRRALEQRDLRILANEVEPQSAKRS
jgi:hypothetical protein